MQHFQHHNFIIKNSDGTALDVGLPPIQFPKNLVESLIFNLGIIDFSGFRPHEFSLQIRFLTW